MNEPVTILTERGDDIPLVLAHMQRMGRADVLDEHVPTHGNRTGWSLGVVSVIWLTHVLSQADHRMNHVQPWAARRLDTVRACRDRSLEVRDLGDDRRADVLRHVSDDKRWRAFEGARTGQRVRVSDLHADGVRLERTTASRSGAVSEDGLLQVGHRKDHRPDVGQRTVLLATLDPLGLPLATEVRSGDHADDPLDLPAIARVRACLTPPGVWDVGDGHMAALETRASIQAAGDSSVCPLSALQRPPERRAQHRQVLRERSQSLRTVERTGGDGQAHGIAQGDEDSETIPAQVEGGPSTWMERRVLVCSQAARAAVETALHARLKHAQTALAELVVRRQGTSVPTSLAEGEHAVAQTVAHVSSGLAQPSGGPRRPDKGQ